MSQAGFAVLEDANIPGDVATTYVTDMGTATPAAHILNVIGGIGTSTSAPGNSNTIVVTVNNLGFQWSEKAVSFAAAVQNGYFCNAALTATLPASGGLVIGNSIIIFVDTASAVVIQAGGGEMIQISSTISAPGGTATSNTQGSTVELVYKPSDSTWHSISSLGSWTVV
jgi:hypothetical protein